MVDKRVRQQKDSAANPINEENQGETPAHEETEGEQHAREIKERDEKINGLEERLEEALKAILILTNSRREEPSGHTLNKEPPVGSTSKERTTEEERETENPSGSRKEGQVPTQASIDEMVSKSVSAALASTQANRIVRKGRPYPAEYELVPYPKGFVPPHFEIFDGTSNPRQHVARFRAQCCNAGGSDALLLRQFITSLGGVAFEWYSELPNDLLITFDEMEEIFIKRFAVTQQKVTVMDLVQEGKKPTETLPEYIIRWRNLSMRCDPQIAEEHAVGLLRQNIKDPMATMLRGFDIDTFQVLLNKVSKFLPNVHEIPSQAKDKEKSSKHKPHEKQEARVSQVAKGKEAMTMIPKANEQKFPVFSLKDKLSKKYSFTRESVRKIFNLLMNAGFQLRESKKPQEAHLVDEPNYCHFHRCLGHTIEDCYVFKDIVEKQYRTGEISLSKKFLLSEASIHMIGIAREETTGVQERAGSKGKALLQEMASPRRPRKGIESVKGKEACTDNEQLTQKLREKDELIKIIERKLEEASSQSKKKAPKHKIYAKQEVASPRPNESKPGGLSLRENLKKKYSFSKEYTGEILELMMKDGFQPRESKRPREAHLVEDPDYCLFHQCLGHSVENCFVFKDIVEKRYQSGELSLSRKFLLSETPTETYGGETSKSKGGWKTAPSVENEEMLQETPVRVASDIGQVRQPTFKHNQDKLLQIIQRYQEEIMFLKGQNKDLEKCVRGLLSENNSLKQEVRAFKEAFRLMTVKKTDQNTKKDRASETSKKDKAAEASIPLHRRLEKQYSFERKGVRFLFDKMLADELVLPVPKRPEEIDLTYIPGYCPYHRCLGHGIEDCFVFKDILEGSYQRGAIQIPEKYLLPRVTNAMPEPKENTRSAAASSSKPPDEGFIIRELSDIAKNSALLERTSSNK